MENKFVIGDKVKIVKYGGLMWCKKEFLDKKPSNLIEEKNGIYYIDTNPEIVGKEAIVDTVKEVQGRPQYAVNGVSKHAWYNEEQLEMVNPNPNR